MEISESAGTAKLMPCVLERGVVRHHVHLASREQLECRGEVGCPTQRGQPLHLQPDEHVDSSVPGHDDVAPPGMGEGHVVEPGRVATVDSLGVERKHERRRTLAYQLQSLRPSGWVL